MKKYIAEAIGTFWLVFGGCGSAIFAAAVPSGDNNQLGIGFLGVSLAFGLTVLTMAYAIGHISGCHLNPAVSFGLWAGKRFPGSELVPYIISQVVGAIVAGGSLYIIATGKTGLAALATSKFTLTGSNPLATNGYDEHSPLGYTLAACFLTEVLMTFMFLIIILGATDHRAPAGFAPVPIGLGLTLIHLISIPITNTSVNPARSTGVALWVGIFGGQGALIGQLWLFWLAPIVGAILAGYVYLNVFEESRREREATAYDGE